MKTQRTLEMLARMEANYVPAPTPTVDTSSADAWFASMDSRAPRNPESLATPSKKVRARRPFELEARQCIIRGQTDELGARPSSRDDNGMAYCGAPRQPSKKHASMRKGAYGDKSKFDSLYT